MAPSDDVYTTRGDGTLNTTATVRGILNPGMGEHEKEAVFSMLPAFRGVVFDQYREHDRRPFAVLAVLPTDWGVSPDDGDVNYPLFRIRFPDGVEIEASHEEVVLAVDGDEITVGAGGIAFGNRLVGGRWV